MATPQNRNLSVGAVVLAAAVVIGFVLLGPAGLCAEINDLIDESASDFESQKGVLLSESMGQWSSSFEMEGSSSCSMFLDMERSGHLCSWEYSNADGSGPVAYDETVANVRACLDGAVETEDPGVNHPDFWAATNFAIPNGEVSVALKNKHALGKVFVSIGVDRFVNS